MIVRPVEIKAFLAGSGFNQRQKLRLEAGDGVCVSFEFVQIGRIPDSLRTMRHRREGGANEQQ
jgi:hypothetical protein